jgi:glycosyltransferase involved in cell wall biosynthesis
MRVALVTDWLVTRRGGEKVFEAFLELFPNADVFTLVNRPGILGDRLQGHRVQASFLQHVPLGVSRYRYFLPLYDRCMAGFDLSGYDLIISGSSACGKWVRNPRRVPHLCYCHTPMRYVWDLFEDYFGPGRTSWPVRQAAKLFRGYLQRCDLRSNDGVTYFWANSTEVKERIRRLYGREAEVLNPPVEVERFNPLPQKGDYYLVFSALVPYKRVDLAVEACTRRNWKLIVAGEGPERARLEKGAGPTVSFLGQVEEQSVPALLAGAKALLFPGLEDFGIVPVEALASGTPVVAYGRGGIRDSLEDGKTGPWFFEQTTEALIDAVERLEKEGCADPVELNRRAQVFSRERFKQRVQQDLQKLYNLNLR